MVIETGMSFQYGSPPEFVTQVTASQHVTSKWSRQAQQDRSRLTQERVIAATQNLLTLRPFHEISVAEIAQEAEASVSSIYARFPNKEALLGALYERHASSQREMVDQLLPLDRWHGVPLGEILRQTFPLIVAGYRAKQGLMRAFLEQAANDVRFRETWTEVGDHIIFRVTELVMSRPAEVRHSDPQRGVECILGIVFSTLAHQIQMHQIDKPEMDELTDELIRMMLRYMRIAEFDSNLLEPQQTTRLTEATP